MSKPANVTPAICAACGRNFKSVKHAGSRSGSHEFITAAKADEIIAKIAIMWEENIEFSRSAPLAWDEFLAGFAAIEVEVYVRGIA